MYVHVHMCTLTCSTTAIIDAHVRTGIYVPYTYMHTYGLLVDQQSLLYQTHVCVCVL